MLTPGACFLAETDTERSENLCAKLSAAEVEIFRREAMVTLASVPGAFKYFLEWWFALKPPLHLLTARTIVVNTTTHFWRERETLVWVGNNMIFQIRAIVFLKPMYAHMSIPHFRE